ncbi:type I-E CRISPR-associated protein Cas7/Cse4/CasC [Streptomyces sp. NBC_01754]|uniref:type I-E CRISPR-associated protein Cas7/Cse4/CasC n=1 Tax=Streptomyces sp. NBC_01754 TaxID=2975930 RepID=UPI002DD7D8DA|nr:type I-E CRISPR-associated protein Cas7/Cse4/CasC [Streptomyces sp. NBC_01754]WSC91237.1 type I-E CRISPR-associated protein Cas7/Cse4/CasC [Streptomyces sp. NBC_01754]
MSASLTRRRFVDVHVLQTVPPSNLNRDDAGAPKEATYGGVRRPRASSQAWKRATRMAFSALGVSEDQLGTRTKQIADHLAGRIAARTGLDETSAARLAAAVIAPLGITASKNKEEESAYLLFYGNKQIEQLVDLVADRAAELIDMDDKRLAAEFTAAQARTALMTGHPVDVALFGRMVANVPDINVDAACQVAHAIATHGAELEFDFYTAVDDRPTAHSKGAGMMGRIGFNSATFYRYGAVSLHQLEANLSDTDSAVKAATAFVSAFVRSMPTGYGNSFAHRTMPQLVAVTIRDDQPVNLVTAFEKPVTAYGSTGYAAPSATALAAEQNAIATTWGAPALWTGVTHSFTDTTGKALDEAFGRSLTFPAMVDALTAELTR